LETYGLLGLVFNITFNKYFGGSVLLVEEHGVHRENHEPVTSKLANFITSCCIIWTRFEFITLVVIGTDYIGSCISNHQTITTTKAPYGLLS
jgi:hypothetical protein